MAQPTVGLTDNELNWIADRLAKVLEGGKVRSFVGLQYRLGEVGQNRIGPRMLQRALAELSNNRRPRRGRIREAGPWELTPRVFADSGLSPAIAQNDAAQVADGVQRLLEAGRAGTLDQLCAVIAAGVADIAPTLRRLVEPVADGMPSGGVSAPFSDTRLLSTAANPPIRIWVTHETEWLFPDNSYLWSFLLGCVRSGSSPVVLARHIDQTTFLLFRALGVRGVQYYSWLIPGESYHEMEPLAKQIGWTHVRPIEQIAEHLAMERMRAVLRHYEEHPGASAPDAVLHGASCDLASGTASPEALLQWANEAEVPFVKGWRDTVHRWTVWAQYRVPRRPSASSWNEPPTVNPEQAKRSAKPTAAPKHARPERTVLKKNPQPSVDEGVPRVSRIGINIHRRR